MSKTTKCGYVAIVGRPNVGKSTLLNAFVGKKISITSSKPQTTRNQIVGIKTINHSQIVFIDTPGLHKTERRAMNRYMNRLASAVLLDADIIIFMIDKTRWQEDDDIVLKKLNEVKVPVILVINKIDKLKDKSQLLPWIDQLQSKFSFDQIIPLSAKNKKDVLNLEKIIIKKLPEAPYLFPENEVTDKSLSFQVAELIREKLIHATQQEIPYSTTVVIESLVDEDKILKINATIWVERDSQKAIVIGKEGLLLKHIGTLARKEIQELVGKKVFLRLWVKVKSDWTDNEELLKDL